MESSASRIRAALIAKTPGLAGYLDSIDDGALVDVANGKTSAVCEFVLKSGIAPNGKHCVIVGKMSGAGSGLDSFMSVRARADGGQEQRIMPQHQLGKAPRRAENERAGR